MASKSFMINTTPHEATIGEAVLLFQPEVLGSSFAEAYSGLKEAQQQLTAAGDNVGSVELLAVNEGMREFVGRFLLPESRAAFDALKLPDRVLVQLLEWVAQLYGGGSGNGPGGSSSES